MQQMRELWLAYRLRWKRRRFLFRAFRKRRQIMPLADRTAHIGRGDILAFATVRNEAVRLPFFLDHYRRLGVCHFLIVDNASDDGTRDYLLAQPDVSLWGSTASYRLSRFGMDWVTWLQMRHGHGHWCLTVDADEILIYPYWETRPLSALTSWLDAAGVRSFAAMMLDMYPQGPVEAQTHAAGQNPFETLAWFDAGNYMIQRQPVLKNLWIQGGVRARKFFADDPRRAPTLNKVPLVKWHRSFAYVNSTHAMLPRGLNQVYGDGAGEKASGILLHTKFLPLITRKSAEEKARREHFANSTLYDDYYDSLIAGPTLWCPQSTRLTGWRQLESLGLMSRGPWL